MNINLSSNPANLNLRRQKFGIISLVFMLLFGGAFMGAGVFALNSIQPDPNWTKVTGDVVEASSSSSSGSTSYTPVVRYVVNGQP